MSKEWIECTVSPCKNKKRETLAAQEYLRKEINKDAKSIAQVTATNI